MHICLRLVRALAIMLAPFLPFSSEKVWKYLGYRDSIFSHSWDEALDDIEEGMELKKPEPLFKKLSLEEIMPEKEEDPFSYLDIRVAKVVEVKDHPNADKLYVLKVDVGEKGERTIVAGLKKYYSKEEIKGKNVIIIANLKPAKLRGIESQGMLLAADDGRIVSLLLADAEPGDIVRVEGLEYSPKDVVDIDEFRKTEIRVDENGKIVYKGRILMVKDRPIRLDKKVEKGARVF